MRSTHQHLSIHKQMSLTKQHVSGVFGVKELASDGDVQLGSLQQTGHLLCQKQGHLLSFSLIPDFLSFV